MKKSIIVTLVIVVVVFIVIIGLVIMGIFSLVKAREPITAEKFENMMEAKNFEIIDAKDQFTDAPYVENALIALNNNYQIEFYVLTTNEHANTMFLNNQNKFEENKGSVSSYSTVNFKNGSKYTLSSNGKYSTITQIDNTVIYLNIDEEYKEEVKLILEEINY